jgi:hypothetical protein
LAYLVKQASSFFLKANPLLKWQYRIGLPAKFVTTPISSYKSLFFLLVGLLFDSGFTFRKFYRSWSQRSRTIENAHDCRNLLFWKNRMYSKVTLIEKQKSNIPLITFIIYIWLLLWGLSVQTSSPLSSLICLFSSRLLHWGVISIKLA